MQIVVDDILTNYQVIGEKKNTLVILPGWRRSVSEWIPIAKNLSSDFRVVLLDLPGFGVTSVPKENFGIYEYAEFVEKFLTKLEIKKCSVLGHSFGGRIGIVLASSSNFLEKLILVDPAGIEKKSLRVKLIQILKKTLDPVFIFFPEFVKNKIRNKIGSADYKATGEMRKIFVKIINQDLIKLLPKIKIPTFIIWGEKDKSLSVSQTKIFKKDIKNSRVRIVWGAGHDPHLQKQDQFLEILEDLL